MKRSCIIEASGAGLFYLASYLPDSGPVGMAFSKLKARNVRYFTTTRG